MKYAVRFPSLSLEDKFYKILSRLPRKLQDEIIDGVSRLSDNPYPYGKKIFKKITPPFKLMQYVAQYRLRFGDYRVLYDVNDRSKTVWIFVLRKRGEDTYK